MRQDVSEKAKSKKNRFVRDRAGNPKQFVFLNKRP